MIPFKGQNATLAYSPQLNLATVIENFTIVNKSASTNTFNVYLISGIYNICISPLNKQLNSGDMYESIRQVCVLASEQIKIQSSLPVDYDFNINNMKIDT